MTEKQEPKETEPSNVLGFPLFHEVEDRELRCRNRGVVMANIVEDNMHGSRVSNGALVAIIKYFQNIPQEERSIVLVEMQAVLLERGIIANELFDGSQHQQLH